MSAQAIVAAKLDAWQQARADLHRLEQAEHPDITDHHGRVWTWRVGDLYTHDNTLCWPEDMVLNGVHGLPDPSLTDNPNYHLCATCTQAWPVRRAA